jgi:hypothetical protein
LAGHRFCLRYAGRIPERKEKHMPRCQPIVWMLVAAMVGSVAAWAQEDTVGIEILSRPGDPDFDTVAAKLPAMTKPREAVGVKDHPYEAGVAYDGTIQLGDDNYGWEGAGPFAWIELGTPAARFGSTGCKKRLLDGYLPVVVAECELGGLRCELTVLGWSEKMSPDTDAWTYARLMVSNPAQDKKEIALAMRFQPESDKYPPLRRQLQVPAAGTAEVCYKLPTPTKGRPAGEVEKAEFQQRLEEARQSWTKLLNSGMQINVPEPRVNDACRAWQAYTYINTDKRNGICEIHDGAGFYEEIFGYSQALACHAFDMWGKHDDARRYLEALVSLVKPDGLIFLSYGLPDNGSLLIGLCEHYRMTGDADWLRKQAPTMVKLCDWLINKRKESLKLGPDGKKPVTYGLIKFTPYCDFREQTFDYYGDAYSCTGLEHVAATFAELGLKDDAARFAKEAAAYRTDILASMDAAVIEHDGVKLLPMEPDTLRLLKDGKYKGGEYYGLVASMFLESELLPPADPRFKLVTEAIEKRGGLILGMSEFADGIDHAYTFGYWLNCLRRDEVKRVLLGFYGSLAYGMSRETYAGVEVAHIMTGEPERTLPHTYSGTQQLKLLRLMLVQEEGRDEQGRSDELILCRAIPRPWLAAGKRVEVRNAPTSFGPVSFTIESRVDQGRIVVNIEPPQRRLPKSIRLCLRQPGEAPIREATVIGKSVERVSGETVFIKPEKGAMRVEVEVKY